MPVILGIQETQIRRISVPAHHWIKVREIPSQPMAGCNGAPVIPTMQEM
jgi:hypothetical protein